MPLSNDEEKKTKGVKLFSVDKELTKTSFNLKDYSKAKDILKVKVPKTYWEDVSTFQSSADSDISVLHSKMASEVSNENQFQNPDNLMADDQQPQVDREIVHFNFQNVSNKTDRSALSGIKLGTNTRNTRKKVYGIINKEYKENPITSWKTAERKCNDKYGPKPEVLKLAIPDNQVAQPNILSSINSPEKERNRLAVKEFIAKQIQSRNEQARASNKQQQLKQQKKEQQLKELEQNYRKIGSKQAQINEPRPTTASINKVNEFNAIEGLSQRTFPVEEKTTVSVSGTKSDRNVDARFETEDTTKNDVLFDNINATKSKKKKSRYKDDSLSKILKETLHRCDIELMSSVDSSESFSSRQETSSETSVDFKVFSRNERIAELNRMADKLNRTCEKESPILNKRFDSLRTKNVSDKAHSDQQCTGNVANESLSLDQVVSKLTARLPNKKSYTKENDSSGHVKFLNGLQSVNTDQFSKKYHQKSSRNINQKSIGPDMLAMPPMPLITLSDVHNGPNYSADYEHIPHSFLKCYSSREVKAAIVIQSYFRGYKIRKITSKWHRTKSLKSKHYYPVSTDLHVSEASLFFRGNANGSGNEISKISNNNLLKFTDFTNPTPTPYYQNLPEYARPFAHLADTGDIDAFLDSYPMRSNSFEHRFNPNSNNSSSSESSRGSILVEDLLQSRLQEKETQTSLGFESSFISPSKTSFVDDCLINTNASSPGAERSGSCDVNLKSFSSSRKKPSKATEVTTEPYIDMKMFQRKEKRRILTSTSESPTRSGSNHPIQSPATSRDSNSSDDSMSVYHPNLLNLGSRVCAELVYQDTVGDALNQLKELENLRAITNLEVESNELKASAAMRNHALEMEIEHDRHLHKVQSLKAREWKKKENALLGRVAILENQCKVKSETQGSNLQAMPTEAVISAATAAVVSASMNALSMSNAINKTESLPKSVNYSSDFIEITEESCESSDLSQSCHSSSKDTTHDSEIIESLSSNMEQIPLSFLSNDSSSAKEELPSSSLSVSSSSSEAESVIKTEVGSQMFGGSKSSISYLSQTNIREDFSHLKLSKRSKGSGSSSVTSDILTLSPEVSKSESPDSPIIDYSSEKISSDAKSISSQVSKSFISNSSIKTTSHPNSSIKTISRPNSGNYTTSDVHTASTVNKKSKSYYSDFPSTSKSKCKRSSEISRISSGQSSKSNSISEVSLIKNQRKKSKESASFTSGESTETYSESFEPESATSDASDLDNFKNSKNSDHVKRADRYGFPSIQAKQPRLTNEDTSKGDSSSPIGALRSTMNLMKKLQLEEETRFNQQKSLLKIQEQSLIDEAKVRLDTIQMEGGPNVRKKHRAVLLQLREQRSQIRRLIETQSLAAQQRKLIFSQHLQLLSSTASNTNIKLNTSSRGQSPSALSVIDVSLSSSDGLENSSAARTSLGLEDVSQLSEAKNLEEDNLIPITEASIQNLTTSLADTSTDSKDTSDNPIIGSESFINNESNFDSKPLSQDSSSKEITNDIDVQLEKYARETKQIMPKKTLEPSNKKVPFNLKFPLSPRSQLKHRRQSSESDDSFTLSQNETASDLSDGEGKLMALMEELALRKLEAEKLRKEKRKLKKERLASQEQALKKQIGAYDTYIEQAKLEIEKEARELQSVSAVKPLIKKPKVVDRNSRKSDVSDTSIAEVDKTNDRSSESSSKDESNSFINESTEDNSSSDKNTSYDNIELEISTSEHIEVIPIPQVCDDYQEINNESRHSGSSTSPPSEISEEFSTETILQSPRKSRSLSEENAEESGQEIENKNEKLDIFMPSLESTEQERNETICEDEEISIKEDIELHESSRVKNEETADAMAQVILPELVKESVDYMTTLFNNKSKDIGEISGRIQERGEVDLKSGNTLTRKAPVLPVLPTIDEAKPLETTRDVLANISPDSLSSGSPSKYFKETPRPTPSSECDMDIDSVPVILDPHDLTSRLLSVQASSGDLGHDSSKDEFNVSSSNGLWLESDWWTVGSNHMSLKEEEDKLNAEIARLEELVKFKELYPDIVIREVPNKPPPPYIPPKSSDDSDSFPKYPLEEPEKPVISPISPPLTTIAPNPILPKAIVPKARTAREMPQPQNESNTISVLHRLSKADMRKLASKIFNIVPTKEEEVLPMLQETVELLFAEWQKGCDPITVQNPRTELTSEEDNHSEWSSYAFKHMLFDITRNLVHEMFVLFNTPAPPVWKKGAFPYSAKPWHVAKNPTVHNLIEFVREKLGILMGWRRPTLRESIMVRWARKRRDMVDQILVYELQTEEASWTHYEEEEVQVKNSLALEIMDDVIDESILLYQDILKRKMKNG